MVNPKGLRDWRSFRIRIMTTPKQQQPPPPPKDREIEERERYHEVYVHIIQ